MTLFEMKKKVLSLIEELNTANEKLTDDPDIALKINDVINQRMFELARMKKIPKYVDLAVNEGDIVDYARIKAESGSEVYQISLVKGVDYTFRAQGTVIKALESGTMEIDFFIYPERITDDTDEQAYVFELSDDALEIMPYGVAGDILKSDVSTGYGNHYSSIYENMKQQLDPRYNMPSVTVEGGVSI